MVFKTLIGAESLQELLGKPGLAVVDCRFDLMLPAAGREAFLTAHIPGACYADLNGDLSAPIGPHTGRHPLPQPAAFANRMGALGIGDDAQVVAYDDANGSFAARLWWMLRWVGHDAVAVLDGGFQAWKSRGGAVQTGQGECRTRRLTLRTDARAAACAAASAAASTADRIANAADVAQALRDPAALLVDARAADRFAGRLEPIDSVAGHIPGAVNHPFTANLGADARFLPAAELKRRWLLRLAGKEPGSVIAMCGSGVTACHNLLSLEVAGLPGAKLYAGSWSEWIRDPKRPVARG